MAQTYTQKLNIPKMNPETPMLHSQIDNALERIDVAALPVTHADSKMHWPMWEAGKQYQKKDVFRTETIPSWGFWEVTTAGTSGTVAPAGSGEGDTVTNGTCVLILRRLTHYVVEDCRLWKNFEVNHVYAAGDVFRTPTTPSWGYWQITTAGTSGTTVPSGTTEGDTETTGTAVCKLNRIGSGSAVLPIASDTVLGGIKVGENLSIDAEGVLSAAGGGGAASYEQINKYDVDAPLDVNLQISRTSIFCLPPVEILKFNAGSTDVIYNVFTFSTGDGSAFMVDGQSADENPYVAFDGKVHLVTEKVISFGDPTNIGNYDICISEEIDLSAYKSIEGLVN